MHRFYAACRGFMQIIFFNCVAQIRYFKLRSQAADSSYQANILRRLHVIEQRPPSGTISANQPAGILRLISALICLRRCFAALLV